MREQGENTSKMRRGEGRDVFVLGPSCEKVSDPVCVCKLNLRMTQRRIQQLILCSGHYVGSILVARNIHICHSQYSIQYSVFPH